MKNVRLHYSHWLFKPSFMRGFDAITLGRHVFFRWEKPGKTLLRHEMIHQEQMDRHGILWFYVLYVWGFLKAYIRTWDRMKAYRATPFEIEAYERQSEDSDGAQ